MPELPEVETVRRTLERQILNKTITDVKVYYERMLENCTKEDFISTLKGKTIKKIDRYGKYLIFIFDDCFIHSVLYFGFIVPLVQFIVPVVALVFNLKLFLSWKIDSGAWITIEPVFPVPSNIW